MILRLPFPPSVNRYWRTARTQQGQKTMISKEGRKFKRLVGQLMQFEYNREEKLTGPVAAIVELYPPDNRRRDIDNYCKALFDAISGDAKCMAMDDDRQIKELHIYMLDQRPGGAAVVTLSDYRERD